MKYVILALFAMFLGWSTFAGNARAQTQSACCAITAINTGTGVVTGKVNASGQTFTFELQNRSQIAALKVGQPIYANLSSKQVSLDGKATSGTILNISAPPAATATPATSPAARTAPPCCIVTALNAQNLVTAKTDTGTFFVFSPVATGLGLMPVILVGQKVYANFTTNQVSIDGVSPVGAIKYLCTPPPNQTCPPSAANCKMTSVGLTTPGCSVVTYQTAVPLSCKPGYYGPQCTACSCSPDGTLRCNDGVANNGACSCKLGYTGTYCNIKN